jgi:hypothetical protein
MTIDHAKLRRSFLAARKDGREDRFHADLKEAFKKREITPQDFSIRRLYENFVFDSHGDPAGRELAESFNPTHPTEMLREAGDAVMASHFTAISGQIVYTRTLDAYNKPGLLWPELFTVVPTQFDGEKIPGLGGIGDQAQSINEGAEYPKVGIGHDYVETPSTIKRGMIVPVTKEAIFFDRTGLLLQRCSEVGDFIAVNKEKRCLDVALGLTDTYRYNGTLITNFDDSSGAHNWDNLAASNALVDWTDIENAELLFDAITDPNTGEPINVMPDMLIVPTALKHTAMRIVSATEVRQDNNANSNTAIIQTLSPSPLNQYRVLSNQYVKARTTSASTWFIGQAKRGLYYMENFPLLVQQAGEDSHDAFHRDIVAQWKAGERGAAACVDPRTLVKNTA